MVESVEQNKQLQKEYIHSYKNIYNRRDFLIFQTQTFLEILNDYEIEKITPMNVILNNI